MASTERLESIRETLARISPEHLRQAQGSEPASDSSSYLANERRKAERFNAAPGDLEGVDCPECLNRGLVADIDSRGDMVVRWCECKAVRSALKRIEKSGLKDVLEDYTFESFEATEHWQKKAKADAQRFLTDYEGKWFFMGGQPGSGKTHLCTAIAGHFMRQGKAAVYMLWRDESVALKAAIMDDGYNARMNELKTAPVLYIDDLFKTLNGGRPTDADIGVAFELLNHRYNNRKLITLLSSERMIEQILSYDEALGSRIYQRTKDYCINLERIDGRNYRLRGLEAGSDG